MKLKLVAAVGFAALLASCSGNTGKSIKDANPGSQSDSISYYYGQMVAQSMFNTAAGDSALNTPEGREAFFKGYQAVLEMYMNADPAYAKGMELAMSSGTQLKSFATEVPEFKFNSSMLKDGFWYAFTGDSIRQEVSTAQTLMSPMVNAMVERQNKQNEETLKASMADYAKKHGMSKMEENKYSRIVKPGDGALIAKGDSVRMVITVKDAKGKTLDQFDKMENTGVVGKTIPETSAFGRQLLTMKSGSTVEVAEPAFSVLNQYAASLGYKQTDYFIYTVTVERMGSTPATPKSSNKGENK